MKDPYSILGISQDASEEDIKKAYKKLALKWHPDRHKTDKTVAEERFKEINEAYNLLKDGKYNTFNPFMSSSFNINDLFNSVFNFNPFHKNKKTTTMSISMEEAHSGCQKKIHLNEINVCTKCKGLGAKITKEPCKVCNGSGQIRVSTSMGNVHIVRSCHVCKGYGHALGDICDYCNGTGKKEISSELVITIPPGILHGQTIYHPKSNLSITIIYSPHKIFKLIDNSTGQIASNVTINMFDAMLGNSIEIDTLNGKKILKVKVGTQPNSIMCIKNGGIGGKADHLINIEVVLLKNLTDEQKELLQKLKQTQENNQW